MSDHYMSDSKCMTRNFIISAVIAVAITLILMMVTSMTLTISIVLLLVLLVIGWFVSAYLCKARTVNRSTASTKTAPTVEAAPEPKAEEKTAPAAEPETVAVEGDKPTMLSEARDGKADDLKKIKGVGPKLEKELHGAGVFHFDQIAAWTTAEVEWADENLVSFKGRVSRDNWVDQAKDLAK